MIILDEAELPDALAEARPRLEAALERSCGSHAFEDIELMVLSGECQLWHTDQFSGVTEIIDYPQKRVVFVHLAGGSLEDMLAVYPMLEEYARIVQADGIEMRGRRGWERVLRQHGYRETAVQVFKELSDG